MEFLNELRKKPSHIRTRVAFGSALGVTLVVALIWSTTLPARLSEIGGTIKEGAEQTASVQTGLDTLIEGIQQETIPKGEEPVPEEDPAVQQLRIEALGGLETWNEENSTSTTPSEGVTSTPTPQTVATSSPEVSNGSPTSTQKEKVILIGTTTKKAE